MKPTIHQLINHRSWRKGLLVHPMRDCKGSFVNIAALSSAAHPRNGYSFYERLYYKTHSMYPKK